MDNIIDIITKLSGLITCITVITGAVTWIINKVLFKPINEKLDRLDKKIDYNKKDDLRYTILSFAGDLRNGIAKTRQEYETIFMFYDKYETIIKSLNEKNGYLETEMEFIKTQYSCLMGK